MKKLSKFAAIRLGDAIFTTKKAINDNMDATDIMDIFIDGEGTWMFDLMKHIGKNTAEVFGQFAQELDEMNEMIHKNNEEIKRLQDSIDEMKKKMEK
jgi:hypothetical protein